MADTTLLVKDADATTKALGVFDTAGVLQPYHLENLTQRAALLAALDSLATQTTLAAVLAKLSADPATQTTLAAVLAKLSADPATQTTLAAVLAKLTADPSTAALQTAGNAATAQVGTRAYGTALTRVTVGASSAQSAAITGTEVAVCFVSATAGALCYVKNGANPTATTNDMPLVSGAVFHMRITTGDRVAAIQNTAGGFLNVIPVA